MKDKQIVYVDSDKTITLGQHLAKLRNDRGLTQEELSLKAGVSRSHLADVERSGYRPSIAFLEKVSHGLNVEVHEVLHGDLELEYLKKIHSFFLGYK